MSNIKIPKVPKAIHETFMDIVEIVRAFCNEHLDIEYCQMIVKLVAKISRKKPSPILWGKANTWAAGATHTIGTVNFLFDKTQKPHVSFQTLADWFKLSKSIISAKSKEIRDMFKIAQLEPEWTLPSKMDMNPMVWMIMVNGFMVDVRKESYDLQLAAFNAGLIPYIPGRKPEKEKSSATSVF